MSLVHVVDQLHERLVFLFAFGSVIYLYIEHVADKSICCRSDLCVILQYFIRFVQKIFQRLAECRRIDTQIARNNQNFDGNDHVIRGRVIIDRSARLLWQKPHEHGDHRLHVRNGNPQQFSDKIQKIGFQSVARGDRLREVSDQPRSEIRDDVFRKAELRLFRIFREILYRRLLLIRRRICNVIEIRPCTDVRGNRLFPALRFGRERNKTHGTRIRYRRARFNVVKHVAVLARRDGDVVGVHVPRKHELHSRVGKCGRYVFIVVDYILAEDFFLHGKMLRKAVMHHSDDRISLFSRGFRLLYHPIFQFLADLSARLMLRRAFVRIVRAITSAIHDNDRISFRGLRYIRQHSRFIASFRLRIRRRPELCDYSVRLVIDRVFIRFQKQLRRGTRRGDGDSVFRIVIIPETVIYIVIAVRHVNLDARNRLLHLFKLFCKVLVPLQFPVLRKIARNHQYVRLFFLYLREHAIQNTRTFRKYFTVTVERVLVIFRILDKIGRQNVYV